MRHLTILFLLTLLMLAAAQATTSSSSLNTVLEIQRPTGNDLLIMRNGERLSGTVTNRNFTLRTFYAQITLDSRLLAGIDLPDEADQIEALITVNNNRFSGFLNDPVFRLRLQAGGQIQVRRENVLKVIFRKREGETLRIAQNQFFTLENGDFFSGRIISRDLTLEVDNNRTPLDLGTIRSISPPGNDNPLTTVKLLDGGSRQGVLAPEDIEIALDIGPRIAIFQGRIDTIYAQEGFVPQPEAATTDTNTTPTETRVGQGTQIDIIKDPNFPWGDIPTSWGENLLADGKIVDRSQFFDFGSPFRGAGDSSNLTDGSLAAWVTRSGRFPHYITFDLGSKRKISRIAFVNNFTGQPRLEGSDFTRDVEIWISDDGRDFRKLNTISLSSDFTSRGPIQPFHFAPTETRFIKFVILSNFYDPQLYKNTPELLDSLGASLSEIMVFR